MADETRHAQIFSANGRSNCELVKREGNRLEFRFPEREGFLTPARWEFRDRRELTEYIAELFSLDVTTDGLRGTGVRFGKYERRDVDGGRAFTFGDPILDLITNPAGELLLGDRRINLAAVELESGRHRSGGLRCIDLKLISDALLNLQLTQAALGQGDFVIIECNSEVVALASTNPSQRDFFRQGDHLRFKAWRRNYFIYWSMGAEIETWGHDFDSAAIEGNYLDTIFGNVCATVKVDHDSDTNDDYVDEYEWGVNAPQPRRVLSNCSANWHGERFRGLVSAGQACAGEPGIA
jgi:hypothetical protein